MREDELWVSSLLLLELVGICMLVGRRNNMLFHSDWHKNILNHNNKYE